MKRFILLFLLGTFGTCVFGQINPGAIKKNLQRIQSAPTFEALIADLEGEDAILEPNAIATMREALWQKYLLEAQSNVERIAAFDAGKISYSADKFGQFSLKTKGATPENGYPVYIALHGGGGGPAEMNDSQWQQMQSYYLNSIDTGIYIAPRGPNNTWNLHFDDDAQAFYGKLLQELRLLKGVDANRIYILGYSAGGDGVYQLAPRFADQLAAASMSAGHHNNVSPINLEHVPMLLQVGELDDAYDRNKETVKYAMQLDALQAQFPARFQHQVYVHAGKAHSYVADHSGQLKEAATIADPQKWLVSPENAEQTMAQTDAVAWLNQFVRNPYPKALHWDARTTAGNGKSYFWLSLDAQNVPEMPIEVYIKPSENRIVIEKPLDGLQICLHEKLVDPNKEILLEVGGKPFKIQPKISLLTMARSISMRKDAAFGFWQTIRIQIDQEGSVLVQ